MTLSKRREQQGSELNRAEYSVTTSAAVTSPFLAVYDLADTLADMQVSRDLRAPSLLSIGPEDPSSSILSY